MMIAIRSVLLDTPSILIPLFAVNLYEILRRLSLPMPEKNGRKKIVMLISHCVPLLIMTDERYRRGWEKLKEVDGEAGTKVIESLKDVAPDLGRYTIEFPFGDIYSRPGLDLKSREMAVVAALTALGNAAPQLRVHIHGALNVGVTREEVIEIIMMMAVYAGFPAALNGMAAAKEVFAEREGKGIV
jgi:4-carboxymuconolactone decarboxylase